MHPRSGSRFLFPQLKVVIKRKFCSSKPPPKFEGGERNFFQADRTVPKKSSYGLLLAKGIVLFSGAMLFIPFISAYIIETTPPDEFDKTVIPELRQSLDKMQAKMGKPPLTDKQFNDAKQRSLAVYQPYISTLRALGITTQKDDTCKTWDMSDPDISEFQSDSFSGNESETKDSYNFANDAFNDDGSSAGKNGESKIW